MGWKGGKVGRVCPQRTLCILSASDLEELLDVGDFGGHLDGWWFSCQEAIIEEDRVNSMFLNAQFGGPAARISKMRLWAVFLRVIC